LEIDSGQAATFRLALHFSALVNETDCGRFLGHVERIIERWHFPLFLRRTGCFNRVSVGELPFA
jgi:hypothetical protein